MNTERDKFLTEAMGECWHEIFNHQCMTHNKHSCTNINFSTWKGFGKLKIWAEKQEWWKDWFRNNYMQAWYYVDPDRFADAVYNLLKEWRE